MNVFSIVLYALLVCLRLLSCVLVCHATRYMITWNTVGVSIRTAVSKDDARDEDHVARRSDI
jgi:hypothetical protein